MLPTAQYLLMAIYCIILSAQHKRCSMSASVPAGTEKRCPWQVDKTAGETVHCKMCTTFIISLMMLQWETRCARLSLFVFVCACAHSLAFVCTFPVLTGWSAAVLESVLTESVGSAGYFYPLACVREQVEALWATARSHSDGRRCAAISGCSRQMLRSQRHSDTACDDSKRKPLENKRGIMLFSVV